MRLVNLTLNIKNIIIRMYIVFLTSFNGCLCNISAGGGSMINGATGMLCAVGKEQFSPDVRGARFPLGWGGGWNLGLNTLSGWSLPVGLHSGNVLVTPTFDHRKSTGSKKRDDR